MKENLKSNLFNNYLLAGVRKIAPRSRSGFGLGLALKLGLGGNFPRTLLAKSLLENLQKRFYKNKKLVEQYDNIFQQFLKESIIEKVPNEGTDTLSCIFNICHIEQS